MGLIALATLATTLVSAAAAAADPPAPECGTTLDPQVAAGQAEAARRQADWGQLLRYRDENLKLPAASAKAPRVVFIGDSITEGWNVRSEERRVGKEWRCGWPLYQQDRDLTNQRQDRGER